MGGWRVWPCHPNGGAHGVEEVTRAGHRHGAGRGQAAGGGSGGGGGDGAGGGHGHARAGAQGLARESLEMVSAIHAHTKVRGERDEGEK